jgi:hypothetical protein
MAMKYARVAMASWLSSVSAALVSVASLISGAVVTLRRLRVVVFGAEGSAAAVFRLRGAGVGVSDSDLVLRVLIRSPATGWGRNACPFYRL